MDWPGYVLETLACLKIFKDCISQTLATAAESTQDWNWAMSHPCFCLQIPRALDGSKTNTVSPFSMSSFVSWSLCPDGTTFWQEYEKRRGSKNGIENGLMLLMDVETFENAHYPQWDIFASTPSMCNRKADGLIVALSGNLEQPLVGQSGFSYLFSKAFCHCVFVFSIFSNNIL